MKRSMAAAGLLLAAGLAATCRTNSMPARPGGTSPSVSGPLRTHENLNATLWMQTAVEYRGNALQAYRAAHVALEAALADVHETAATEQTQDPSALPPAVVLDLDETVLDNSPFEARMIADSTPSRPVGYSEAAWRRWVSERKATAIPGAVEFLQFARSRDVTPIYITNRVIKDADNQDTGKAATRDVLTRLNIPLDARGDTLLMRGEHGWDTSDKGPRRAYVAARYRILLLVGDNFEDFVSVRDPSVRGRDDLAAKYADRWGSRWIILPNPTYGSWEQALTLGADLRKPQDPLNRKYGFLRLGR